MAAATSMTATEILVHITAPSRAADDARYRALASAYLAFEPAHTTRLPRGTATESPQRSLDAFVSPQASFRSVWDNVKPPSLPTWEGQPVSQSNAQPHTLDVSQKGNETQASSWIAPPSEVPDSMPDNDISVAAFCTPTRVLDYFLQTAEPPSALGGSLPQEAYDTVIFSSGGPSGSPNRPARKRPRTGEQTPPSPIRRSKGAVTPSIGLVPEADLSLECIQADQLPRVGIDGTAIIPSTQQWERAGSAPPSSERPNRCPTRQEAPALGRSVSDVLPAGSKQGTDAQQVSPEEGQEEDYPVLENPDWSHVTEIMSAEPLAANHTLGPRPPASLERLADDMEMQRRYRPSYQARDMRPYERGYWLVKLDGWDHHEKVAFWGFLGNWIRRDGNAGWGTRACRDEAWGWVRLYGWEHIAGELYILLYVASYRLLKCMEMKFYDGSGDVLIVVGARSDRRRLG